VVKGFGMKLMMLLTSCPVEIHWKESVWRIMEWYNLEDIRVRDYISIRNIVVLVLATSYFALVYLG